MATQTSMETYTPIDPNDPDYLEAQKRVRKLKKFYVRLGQWAGFSAFFLVINLLTSGTVDWALYPIFFWGLSLFFSFMSIMRMKRFDQLWEARQIHRMLGRPLPEGGNLKLPEDPDEKTPDYSKDLLNKSSQEPVREPANLSDYRKLPRPWKDEDLV